MVKKAIVMLSFFFATASFALPPGFVYLKDVDPSILQDMRYDGYHNFVGHPIPGYKAPACILTKPAAQQLKIIQRKVNDLGYTLKVYDCYRPQQAVDYFVKWSQEINQQQMKAEFYPLVNKQDVFKLDYVAAKSGHSRGSTVDLTLVKSPAQPEASYHPGQKLVACFAPQEKRYQDNSIDMGTGYDCFDKRSHPNNKNIPKVAVLNRLILSSLMQKYGFYGSDTEWWHYTLKKEPYPKKYFNFLVE